jgi:hypothetical protein
VTGPPRRPSDLLKSLRDGIAGAEARLAELADDQASVAARLSELRAELAAVEAADRASEPVPAETAPRSPAEKVALFRSLFAGRDDVFAKFCRPWASGPSMGRPVDLTESCRPDR